MASTVQRLRIGDQQYDFDKSKLMLSEARLVKEWTGLSPAQWEKGLSQMDPDCVAALVGLLKRRAGEEVDFDTLDFDFGAFGFVEEPADQDEQTPGPTPAAETEGTSSATTPAA